MELQRTSGITKEYLEREREREREKKKKKKKKKNTQDMAARQRPAQGGSPHALHEQRN